LRFGAFEAEPEARELRKQGLRIRLPDQSFQILLVLLENPSRLVAREELHKRLWPADTFVEFDHNLNNAISRLREALGDSADSPRFIETLPRRGYRFLAEVHREGELTAQEAATQQQVRSAPRHWRLGAVALAAAVLLLPVAGYFALRTPAVAIDSLVVLPLTDVRLGSSGEEDYFAYAMTDALTTELSKIGALRVTSLTSAMHFKDSKKRLPEIARELGVDAVVEGTVAREGNQVRITVQLIDAATDKHLWAETYQREVGSILFLQSDVALAIARELHAQLTPDEEARIATQRQVHPEAYRLYLLGRYHWNKRTPEGFNKATEFFQEAIALDPVNAPAYAGLASNYLVQASWGTLPPGEAFPMAKKAAEKALTLDDSLAEPYTTLASILSDYESEWVGAERAFRRALELNPNHATARHWYGLFLSALGRHDEAIEQVWRAGELNPLSPIISRSLSTVLYMARRFDQAIEQCHVTERTHPGFSANQQLLGLVYAATGKNQEALTALDQAEELAEIESDYGALGWAYAAAGRKAKAQEMLVRALKIAQRRQIDPGAVGLIYIGLGQNDDALTWLEKAHQQRGSYTNLYLKVDPMFDPLRSSPRFQELLRKMNLP
jgi:TolB-like protein/DNA-binding winged helix-turn-helix (wHTH) protein/Tfp pilus assembly protein PilF